LTVDQVLLQFLVSWIRERRCHKAHGDGERQPLLGEDRPNPLCCISTSLCDCMRRSKNGFKTYKDILWKHL